MFPVPFVARTHATHVRTYTGLAVLFSDAGAHHNLALLAKIRETSKLNIRYIAGSIGPYTSFRTLSV